MCNQWLVEVSIEDLQQLPSSLELKNLRLKCEIKTGYTIFNGLLSFGGAIHQIRVKLVGPEFVHI